MHISAKQNSTRKSFYLFFSFYFILFHIFQSDELFRDCIKEIHFALNEAERELAGGTADADAQTLILRGLFQTRPAMGASDSSRVRPEFRVGSDTAQIQPRYGTHPADA